MRSRVALVATVLLSCAMSAWALDRVRAIEAAKSAAGSKCSDASPCTFEATLAEGKWHVRVNFGKVDSPKGKTPSKFGSHAIFIIDATGRIVGRIERE